MITPLPPPFLTGPASFLFTNWPGFSAQVDTQPQGGIASAASGQLLGRGTRLFYAPATDESDKRRSAGGYSFIWYVTEKRGYVLSEALQGYAPVAADLQVTNVVFEIGKAPAERLSGHPCESAEAVVQMADGTAAGLGVFRALDLKGFPLRVESATNTSVFILSVSKVRLEAPPAEVFAPPDGFTKYSSVEAMADELAARQNNLRHKSRGSPVESLPQQMVPPQLY